jgi:internalin A
VEPVLTHIADYLWTQSWQIALLVVAVALASWALRNRSAHVRYLLWLLVLAKCLTPPLVEVPLAVLPDRAPPAATPILSTTAPQEEVAQTTVEKRLPPTPTSAPPEPLHLTTRQWLAVGWLAGVAVFASIALTKAARTILWLRRERRTLPRTSGDSFEETFRSLRVKRPPHIWLIEGVGQPFVWGFLRGDIYLPNRFAGIEDDEHRRDILAHELSHVLRFDAAVNILQIIAQAIFWFHPLLWWANQRIRREREKCCDEVAIAHLGAKPKDYSIAILNTLIQAQESTRPVPSLAVAGPVKNIEERIRAMLRPGKRFHTRPSLAVAAMIVLVAFVAVPTTLVLTARGQTPPTIQSADKPATNSEKPKQFRFAARTFNSKLAFSVWYQTEPRWSRGWASAGRTPSATPVEIPACNMWWVRPEGTAIDWDMLVREVRENKVPGLVPGAWHGVTDSHLRYLADLTELELLDLNSASITDAGLEHIQGLAKLLYLELSFTSVTDAGLEQLKGLGRLECLDLCATAVGDAGLAYLSSLSRLKQLNLDRTKITDAGLIHLEGLPGLEQLNVNHTGVTNAGLAHLKNLTTLQSLDLEKTQITDAGLAHLRSLTGLRSLSLANTTITDAGLEHLQSLTGLQSLGLTNAKITDAGLEHLKALKGLASLDFSGTQVTDAGLVHLKGLTQLQHLDLRGTQVTDAALESLEGLTELGHLNLSGTRITDAGLEHLKGLNRLWNLHLSDTQIAGAGLIYLQDLSRLRMLHLCRTPITDAGLAHLKGLNGLWMLNLFGAKLTDAGLSHLPELTGLGWLVLSGTQITDAGLEHCQGLKTVITLDLDNTQITDSGLKYLQALPQLGSVNLSGTQVTDTGVQELQRSLPKLDVTRGDASTSKWISEG